jgi:biotin carboxylase
MLSQRVVVIGTTSDYVDLMRTRYPGRVLFVTDPAERAGATERDPGEEEEILCDLTDSAKVVKSLRDHTTRRGFAAKGVACFDCESLELSARVAEEFGVPFPSPASVLSSRNKFLSKKMWLEARVTCPRTVIARSVSDVTAFMDRVSGPVVLKPITGSGSELVFKCTGRSECLEAFETIRTRLSETKSNRMYMQAQTVKGGFDPGRDMVAEEFVAGEEYSSDFYLEGGNLRVVRTARKIQAVGDQVGTTVAYEVPGTLPAELPVGDFEAQLRCAAHAIGLQRALCMVDFIVREGKPYLLELTPRPGGDCLPWLIRQSSGLDMLGLTLDIAQGVEINLPAAESWESLVGLRLIAADAGVIKRIEGEPLKRDPRVREVLLKRRNGHRVVLPPKDYDSRILGHVIFRPSGRMNTQDECSELASKLVVQMEARY